MALRITPTQSDRQFLRYHTEAQDTENQLIERLSSLKRVNRPSDDPTASAQIIQTHKQLSENKAYQSAIQQLMGNFSVVENGLNQMYELMVSAQEKAVQGASETYSATARVALADEIDQIREEMLAQLNVQYQGRYVFSGTATDTQPFDATGTYFGDTNQKFVEINTSQTVPEKFFGSDIAFGTGGMGSPEDMLDMLSDLSIALRADNTVAIDAELQRFDPILNRLNTAIGTLGARTATLLREEDRYTNFDVTLQEILSEIEDADLAEEITNLELNKVTLESQLRAQNQISRLNLFNFLG
ncbi:MAG: flagellar hook-associated protein FlgL [Acidobacteria bacterium]|nr:flagellar hook-associated protein FlgL [Acidobacteriota bacterium]MCB9396232.1 flagellar hook-associated protein FlgL [Acidobacteriota bacterium]